MEPEAKKPRAAEADEALRFVNEDLLNNAVERAKLQAAYAAAKPYRHAVVQGLFQDSELRKVRAEILGNLRATPKETDIYKMIQTGDLGNIAGLPADERAQLANVERFRHELNTKRFRSFIQEIAGCGPLSDTVDCACNMHSQGGHLVCHDDVIGDRRLSYIIYMPDPDEDWGPEDGGGLELYPVETPRTPATAPVQTVVPKWGTMAFFTVEPGVSFHAVQEVFSPKLRCSIQGWYHAASAPPQLENASLSQILAGTEGAVTCVPYGVEEATGVKIDELNSLLNPEYLSPEILAQIKKEFTSNGRIQLRNFLQPKIGEEIRGWIAQADKDDGVGRGRPPQYTAGIGPGWKAVGPPHIQRFIRLESGGESALHRRFSQALTPQPSTPNVTIVQLNELFESGVMRELLHKATGFEATARVSHVRRFRAGMDYTLALPTSDGSTSAVECSLVFVDDKGKQKRKAWNSDEVGGYQCYMEANGSEDAAVYRSAGTDSDVTTQSASSNSLSIVLRGPKTLGFVKYVSANAPGSRWDVSSRFV